MKSIRKFNPVFSLFFASVFFFTACGQNNEISSEDDVVEFIEEDAIPEPEGVAANTIKLALLLDTSNSMDGLIEQAKSQLWKIVNELSYAMKNGEHAELLISLYEYGNDNLKSKDGYIRQVLPFTSDLDTISQELFALRTFGGNEYCGEVISKSMDELAWDSLSDGLQVIVIAGNEEFDQGEVNYKKSCEKAVLNNVFINTIFCGDEELGRATYWGEGAELANGFYGTINMDEATVYIETPYDQQINALNDDLNSTYIAYGANGNQKLMGMSYEDQNAASYGTANTTERTIVKSKKHMYKNASWDLVDASDKSDFKVSKIAESDLPDEMKNMSDSEKEAYIEKMKVKREEIQNEINALSIKRSAYIEEKKKEMDGSASLEDAIIAAIKKQAIEKNFTFEKEVALY